jgi:hypothetical protein
MARRQTSLPSVRLRHTGPLWREQPSRVVSHGSPPTSLWRRRRDTIRAVSEPERERGPLEAELHHLIRSKGLAAPEILNATVEGRELTDSERINISWQMEMTLMEALLRLAREVDDLRATL